MNTGSILLGETGTGHSMIKTTNYFINWITCALVEIYIYIPSGCLSTSHNWNVSQWKQ